MPREYGCLGDPGTQLQIPEPQAGGPVVREAPLTGRSPPSTRGGPGSSPGCCRRWTCPSLPLDSLGLFTPARKAGPARQLWVPGDVAGVWLHPGWAGSSGKGTGQIGTEGVGRCIGVGAMHGSRN